MDIRYAGFEVFIIHAGFEHHFSCRQGDTAIHVDDDDVFYPKCEIMTLEDLTEYAIKYLKGEL
jgi:hypothetical protein